MDKEISLREYRPGDEAGIVEALQATFPGWAKNKHALEFWRWKYLDSPLGAYVAVSEAEDHIIACNHDLRLHVKVGDQTLRTHWTDDLCVLPAYREQNLWARMRKMRNESPEYTNLRFKYSSSANPRVIESWKKRGSNIFPHNIQYMIRIRDVRLHLQKRPVEDSTLAEPFTELSLRVLKGIDKIKPGKRIKEGSDYHIDEVETFPEEVNEFWGKAASGYNFIVERSREYLNWRFINKPWWHFKKIMAVDLNGTVLGYAALRTRSIDDYPEGHIWDLLALPEREDVAYSLFKEACKYFDETGINVVYYRCSKGHPYQKIARNYFLSVPGKNLFINYEDLRPEGKAPSILAESKKGEISLSYADTF